MHGYNKGVRPVEDWKSATTVYIDIMIYTILGVDEKNQVMTTYIWYNQSWVDEFLTWDPEKFDNVTKISIPTQWVWIPDIVVTEQVDAVESADVAFVYLDYTGRIYNNKPMLIKSSCKVNLYYFPFDHQNCCLTFTSWIHTIQDMDLSFWRHANDTKSFTSLYKKNGEWDILEVIPSYSVLTEYEDGHNFGMVEFYIIIRREPMFYAVNLILPGTLLMIMDIAGFYLPPESGERTSFKITLLLGYSVFLVVVSDNCPPTGTPLIGSYFVICMVLLVISVMESIFIVRIIHQETLHRSVPQWVKTLVLEKMATLVCLKGKDYFAISSNNISDISEQKEDNNSTEKLTNYNDETMKYHIRQLATAQDPDVQLRIIKEIQESLKKNTDRFISREWLHVGYIIDTFLFRLYILAVVLFMASMAAIWAHRPQA
ncbi:5-hydroxytryptamine receptor 3A-like [Phyllobates terribilis]|uniref:5-hydroxytryptamine receptor 3A-like n=1 Tax=Phyllobates terribilis TaxID=111132 RepID=UPI003CCB34FA